MDYMQQKRRKLMDDPIAQLDPHEVSVVRRMLAEKAPDLLTTVLGDAA